MNQEEIVTPILQPIELINGALQILVPVRPVSISTSCRATSFSLRFASRRTI